MPVTATIADTTSASTSISGLVAGHQSQTSNGEDSAANRWRAVIDSALRMLTLQDDWDGEGAEAPSQVVVHTAVRMLHHRQSIDPAPPDYILSLPDGEIVVEWRRGREYVRQADIERAGIIQWMEMDSSGLAKHWEERYDLGATHVEASSPSFTTFDSEMTASVS